MLERIIKHDHLKVGEQSAQFLYSFPTLFANGHLDTHPVFTVDLHRFVADTVGRAVSVGEDKSPGLAPVTTAENRDFQIHCKIVKNILHMRSLPGTSDSNIPDSHYRNIEFFLRQDTPVEHPIADTRHASIHP